MLHFVCYRYKEDVSSEQKDALMELCKVHVHTQVITVALCLKCLDFLKHGCTVVSSLDFTSSSQAQGLSRNIVMRSWTRLFTLTVPWWQILVRFFLSHVYRPGVQMQELAKKELDHYFPGTDLTRVQ